jgi:membrane protease YdiL (CAAX protease family)
MTRLSGAILLVPALGLLWLFLRGDMLGRWRREASWRRYPAWVVPAWTLFGAGSVTLLAVMGELKAVVRLPAALAPVRAAVVEQVGAIDPWGVMGLAALGGLLLGGLVAGYLERRGRRVGLGDVERVMPYDRRELRWAAALAVTAGITEELYFRLLLPLLIAVATGSAWLGVACGILLFGAAHRYQGWAGILATTAVGLLMTIVHLATGSLVATMLLHAFIDLNAVVLRPIVSGRISSSAATRS